jgi:hypothetical protein
VHLHAAFVPPARLRVALTALVRAQEPEQAAAPKRRGLLGRRTVEQSPPGGPLLDVLDPDSMRVPITDFGFIRPNVARDLGEAIERAAKRYQWCRCRFMSALLNLDRVVTEARMMVVHRSGGATYRQWCAPLMAT